MGSLLSFVEFGGQTSKNVHDVQNMCLNMTLFVYACFVEFYIFVLDEIHMRGAKLEYGYDLVGNVWANIPKDHPRVLEEGSKITFKDAQTMKVVDF